MDQDPLIGLRTLVQADMGERLIYFVTMLADYPHITNNNRFKVTFYMIFETMAVPDKYHQIFGSPLEIKFQPFTISPSHDYDWVIKYELSKKNLHSTSYQLVNVCCDNWITFDENE